MGAITDTATVGGNLRVTLNAESRYGFPGDTVLCTLSHPASFSENAVNRFGASTCPALAPNTWYFVVVERFTYRRLHSTMEVFTSTSSSSYDSRAAGWRLDDQHLALWILQSTGGNKHRRGYIGSRSADARCCRPSNPSHRRTAGAAQSIRSPTRGTDGLGRLGPDQYAEQTCPGVHDRRPAQRGYELSNIGIRFGAIAGSGVHSDFTVSLHAGGADNPGDTAVPAQ